MSRRRLVDRSADWRRAPVTQVSDLRLYIAIFIHLRWARASRPWGVTLAEQDYLFLSSSLRFLPREDLQSPQIIEYGAKNMYSQTCIQASPLERRESHRPRKPEGRRIAPARSHARSQACSVTGTLGHRHARSQYRSALSGARQEMGAPRSFRPLAPFARNSHLAPIEENRRKNQFLPNEPSLKNEQSQPCTTKTSQGPECRRLGYL